MGHHHHHHHQSTRQPKGEFSWLSVALLVGLAFGAYLSSVTNSFSPLDEATILTNPRLSSRQRWSEFWLNPNSPAEPSRYQPLTMYSFALDRRSSGASSPAAFRKTNVLAHALCVLAAYGLVLWWSRRNGLAVCVAAILAVHPLTTGGVSSVTDRGQLLAALAMLVSLVLFTGARRATRLAGVVAGSASLLAFAAALLCAETALIFPVIVAAFLLALDARPDRQRWWWVAGFVALDALYLAVRWNALGGLGLPVAAAVPAWQQVVLPFQTIGLVAGLAVLPAWVRHEHMLAGAPWSLQLVTFLVGAAGVLAAALWLARARRSRPLEWFGVAWAGATMLPVWWMASRTGAVAERWLYLPLLGIAIGVCAAALRWLERSTRVRVSITTLAAAVGVIVAALLFGTVRRNGRLRNPAFLMVEALAQSPQSAAFHVQYGTMLARQGLNERALEEFRQAVALEPNAPQLHTRLAIALGEAGQIAEATPHFREALRLDPNNPKSHFDLAVALAQQRQYNEAIGYYRAALATATPRPDAANNLAWLLATCPEAGLRNAAEALQWATLTVQWAGEEDIDALDTLAAAHAEAGNFDEAASLAQRAERLAARRSETARAADIRSRLKLYIASQPYHEAP